MDIWAYQLSNCGTTTVASGPCGTDAGTYTSTLNGSPVNSPVYLCSAGGANCFSLISNDNYILPPPDAHVGVELPELFWAIYTGVPSGGDPALDPNWSGYYWTGEDVTDCDNSPIPGIIGVQSIYWVPNALPHGAALITWRDGAPHLEQWNDEFARKFAVLLAPMSASDQGNQQ